MVREQGRRREQAISHNKETSTTGHIYHAQGKKDHLRDASPSQGTRIALPLILVRSYSPVSKRSHLTYALLDNGSNVALYHEWLLQMLNLQGPAATMNLTTLDKTHTHTDPSNRWRKEVAPRAGIHARRNRQMVSLEGTATASRPSQRSDAPDRPGLPRRPDPLATVPRQKGS